jgi:NAD(P)-dependent dehydrogenase (short-subunit alcohol dehydrogenase family)
MRSLGLELSEYDIRVNTVLPGIALAPFVGDEVLGYPSDADQEHRQRGTRNMSLLSQGDPLPPDAIAEAASLARVG